MLTYCASNKLNYGDRLEPNLFYVLLYFVLFM